VAALNCYTVQAVQQAMADAFWALLLGAFLACWLGAVVGRATYWSIFVFVRRTKRFRRFDRAMRKVFA
jgi:hypothetical protein